LWVFTQTSDDAKPHPGWFGLEGQDDLARPGAMELYIGAVSWASSSDKRTIATTMTEIQTSGLKLNTIRLPVAPQTLVQNHPDGDYSRTDVKIRNNDATFYPYANAYAALEDFIIQASKNNLYLILDLHSCSNHIGWRAGRIDDGPPCRHMSNPRATLRTRDSTAKSPIFEARRNHRWHGLAQGRHPKPGAGGIAVLGYVSLVAAAQLPLAPTLLPVGAGARRSKPRSGARARGPFEAVDDAALPACFRCRPS
jgi:Cellulase (glycosyl hydrolase family 5)